MSDPRSPKGPRDWSPRAVGIVEPGRELDFLIHRKIMREEPDERTPHYSTDRIAALVIVEFLMAGQCSVELLGSGWYDGQSWRCRIGHPLPSLVEEEGRILGEGEDEVSFPAEERASLPMAVCRAALEYFSKMDRP